VIALSLLRNVLLLSSPPASSSVSEGVLKFAHRVVVSAPPEGRATASLGIGVVDPTKNPASTQEDWLLDRSLTDSARYFIFFSKFGPNRLGRASANRSSSSARS